MKIGSALPLDSPHRQNGKDSPEEVKKAAEEFEALLIGHLLKQARLSETGFQQDGTAEADALFEMAEEQFGRAIASQGGLGLAGSVQRSLAPSLPTPQAVKLRGE